MASTLLKLKFWLPGVVIPKARPRVSRNSTYLPQRYQDWQRLAIAELLLQISDRTPLEYPVVVRVLLQGKGHRGDIDNLAGSCLDALVKSGILEDDRLSCVGHLEARHEPKGETGCWIEIEPKR